MARRRIAITGASGLVGSALTEVLRARGDQVVAIVRARSAEDDDTIYWNVHEGAIDAHALEGFDAVVHLAGESITGRWTEAHKERIEKSRTVGTRLLAGALAGLEKPPKALVCASAIGCYGDRGDEVLDESSAPGGGFLADVVKKWEGATDPARAAGIRVVHLRLGLVLAARGGALAKMLPLFKAGAGGKLGNGKQWWSWVALEDVVRAFVRAIDDASMFGAYLVAAPAPATNAAFTAALGRALHRPAFLPAPAFALRLAMGEMANELLLSSQRAHPKRLLETGFTFTHHDLEETLRALTEGTPLK